MRIIKSFFALLFISFLLVGSASYAENANGNKKAMNNVAGSAHKKDMGSAENLKVQRFILDATEQLGVEFRYVNDRLKYIYLWNTGEPLELDVLSRRYVLGMNNDIELKTPNVEKIILHVYPYSDSIMAGQGVNLLSKTYLFSENDDGLYELNSKYYPS